MEKRLEIIICVHCGERFARNISPGDTVRCPKCYVAMRYDPKNEIPDH